MLSPDCPGLLHSGAAKILPWVSATQLPSDKQIHQLRLAIKSLRAGLALMRPWLHQQPLKRRLQQLNRYLSSSRDLHVAKRWLDFFSLGQVGEGKLHSLVLLRDYLDQPLEQTPLVIAQLQALALDVIKAVQQLPHYQPKLSDWRRQLRASGEFLCQEAPQLYLHYEQHQDCTPLHRWRKLVKRHFFQQKLLQPFALQSSLRHNKLKQLGTLLGEVQDLCLLSQLLEKHAAPLRSAAGKQDFFASQQFLLWQREARLAEAAALQESLANS